MINPSFLTHISDKLSEVYSQDVVLNEWIAVGGGDINSAYKLRLNCGNVFLKTNYAQRFPDLFESERDGLKVLKDKTLFLVPIPLIAGVYMDQVYLIMEFIEFERNGDWDAFGSQLANMHEQTQDYFGLERSNYIGSIVQENTPKETWTEFYSELRLYPLMKKMIDQHLLSIHDAKHLEALVKELSSIYPHEKPSLLHGDLWSGNVTFVDGSPAVYDPAVYYGHREMDIAMTYLFGGFPAEMMNSYIASFPLEKGWRERLEISQLYPLMVHALLFGGSYTKQVREIIKRF